MHLGCQFFFMNLRTFILASIVRRQMICPVLEFSEISLFLSTDSTIVEKGRISPKVQSGQHQHAVLGREKRAEHGGAATKWAHHSE